MVTVDKLDIHLIHVGISYVVCCDIYMQPFAYDVPYIYVVCLDGFISRL